MARIKNNIYRLIISILLGIILLFLVLFIINIANPYTCILKLDGPDQLSYLSFYEKTLSRKKFDLLLAKLLKSNDARTVKSISYYCNLKKKCDKIPLIEATLIDLYARPLNSTWVVQIDFSQSRVSSREMLEFANNPKLSLAKLKAKCN